MKRISNQVLNFLRSKLFNQYAVSKPITLVDVGARREVHSRWDLFGENVKVIGFEPDLEECNRLNKTYGKKHRYFPIALYNRSGQLKINICKNPATSSVYAPNRLIVNRFFNAEDLEIVRNISVPSETLDRILSLNNIHDVDLIKIDTQGSELQILQGSRKMLRNSIFGVDIEVEFSQLYKNQPLFTDADIYLRDLGFSLFDINLARLKRKKYNNVYSKGQVLWAHALYFRDFLLNKNIHSNCLNFKKAIKTIAIAEIYGFSDFALELLDFYNNKEIIDIDVYKDIKNMLIKNKLSPEYRLFANIRSTIGSYLKERIPSIYNLIKKRL